MPIELIDGKGSGIRAEVNKTNELRVRATQHTEEHNASQKGEAYLASSGQVAGLPTLTLLTTEGGDILYLENTGTVPLVIGQISVNPNIPGGIVTFYKNRTKGVLSQNTPIIPANLNYGSAKVAAVQCEVWDETNGNGIQGLSNGDIHAAGAIGPGTFINTEGTIIIPQGKSIGVHFQNDTGSTIELTVTVRFYFDDETQ